MADAIGSSLRALTGFCIGSALAVIIGIAVGWSSKAERIFDPTVQLLRPMPRTALLPFAIIFFGLGNLPALFLVVYGVFMQVYLQVVIGVKLVSRDWRRAAAMLGASPDPDPLARDHPRSPAAHLPRSAARHCLCVDDDDPGGDVRPCQTNTATCCGAAMSGPGMDIVLAGMLMLGLFGYLSDRIIVMIA